MTWNSQGHIGKCLQSLREYGPRNNQTIVVDNASTDRTVEEIRGFPDVELVRNTRNMGLGYATCQAYARSRGDLLLVANPDIVFTGLPELLNHAREHPDHECMMPQLISSKQGVYKTPIHWHRFPHFLSFAIGVRLDRLFRHFLTEYCLRGERPNAVVDDKHVYGVSCMLLRRRLIERMGGIYNPKYRWAWADADLGMRFARYKAVGCSVPESSMDHYGGYSSQKMSSEQVMFLYANGQKLWEKDWGHSTRYFIAQFIDTIAVVLANRLQQSLSVRNKICFLKGWLS